jgi:hypothetical protein
MLMIIILRKARETVGTSVSSRSSKRGWLKYITNVGLFCELRQSLILYKLVARLQRTLS